MQSSETSPGQDILNLLRATGQAPDEAVTLGDTALLLGALDRAGADLAPYRRHLSDLARDVADGGEAADTPQARAQVLSQVLADLYGYDGDQITFDDPYNANLLSVIDRRRGLPVTLGILYLHAGQAQGWAVNGLNYPGHFLVSVGDGPDMAVIDPFQSGRILGEHEIQGFLQRLQGEAPPRRACDLGFMSNRAILIRLLSNIKQRAVKAKDNARALEVAERLVMIAPGQPLLLYDFAALNAQVGHLILALQSLVEAVRRAPDDAFRRKAEGLLDTVKRQLN